MLGKRKEDQKGIRPKTPVERNGQSPSPPPQPSVDGNTNFPVVLRPVPGAPTVPIPPESTEAMAKVCLDLIREYAEFFNILKRDGTAAHGKPRNYLKLDGLHSQLERLCDEAEKVFGKKERVIKLESPAFLCGDLHGNLHDLLLLDRVFAGKDYANHIILFLGDYVDREKSSIETFIFLVAMKLLHPKRFHMLRGNHEIKWINRQYTLPRECEKKLGSNGKSMYKRFNRLMDFIPPFALVDGKMLPEYFDDVNTV